MVAAIAKEIAITPMFNGIDEPVETIYLGGGTPSILSREELRLLLTAVHNKFGISVDVETTLEANPDDIGPANLAMWSESGINRLSTGVQSFSEAELAWMNRAHSAADALRCIDDIKQAGFRDFSIDLIYGSPLLSNEGWEKNVKTAIEKGVPHISCYALTVEPKTALAKMIATKSKPPVDPEKQAEQFVLLMDWMREAGYDHYEISNFALPGMRSRHNSSYWQGKSYYGFGPSAHSFNGQARRWNIANNALYIQSITHNSIPLEEEFLSSTQHLNEYIMTALRTMEGLELEKVSENFGEPASKQLLARSQKWQLGEKVRLENSRLVLTNEGKLFADGIAADLFF